MKLSKRLMCVADFVPKSARLADIGSDHAYLPSFLAQQGKLSFAIAGEVVQGPFESAKETIIQENLQNIIDVRLGDGLDVVNEQDNIDTITICGMGGELIAQILERGRLNGKLKNVRQLILQPNVGERNLRLWLMQNSYRISHEVIMEEAKKRYEIIVAIPNHEPVYYTQEQLQFGVYLPLEKNRIFIEKWQSELVKLDKVISSLKKSSKDEQSKIQEIREQQAIIKGVIGDEC